MIPTGVGSIFRFAARHTGDADKGSLLRVHTLSKVTKAEAQRRYRQERALATGLDADARRRRDAALRRERQNRYLARLVLSTRTHTLDELPPDDTTVDPRTSTEAHLVCENRTLLRTRHSIPSVPGTPLPFLAYNDLSVLSASLLSLCAEFCITHAPLLV